MIFTPAALSGVCIVEPEPLADERGFFARTFCAREFEAHGLETRFVQCNASYSSKRGTLRGLHYQVAPFEEAKLVRCVAGAIHDVVVDVRPGSATRWRHQAFELTGAGRRMLYIPPGFAHGYQTLRDETEVFYQISAFYVPECERGLRWNDPVLAISWPLPPSAISAKDQLLPFVPAVTNP